MKFPFNTCPSWFTNFLVDEYQDEFHYKFGKYNNDRLVLLESAKKYFNQKGLKSWIEDNQLWFDIDINSPLWTFRILKFSE
jgi:hypothetical protein